MQDRDDGFTDIVNTYSRHLFSRAFFITGNRPVAEDIVQETFLKLWRKKEDLVPGELGGWLHTVASHSAYSYRRREARRREIARTIPLSTWYAADVEERLDGKNREASLHKILCDLPRQQRLVYEMSKRANLSRAEIAERLHLSPHTVKVHLQKAVQFIRENMIGVAVFLFLFAINNIFFRRDTTITELRSEYIYMILQTRNLSHKYSSTWAIRDINLEIDHPGIIGLLGPNGAGKSTTMNIVCGVLNQTEGDVFIMDIDLRKAPEAAKKHIGFLPQTPPLYTDLTIDEYLTYAAELRLVEKGTIKKAVAEVKERCGIAHFSSRLIRNLSGGYRQRVGIAQAIIHKPALIVMDEPTNGLDPNQIIEMRRLIREIAEEHTILLSSHILSEINILCKEIIMIDAGRIVFSESMDAFNNYIQAKAVLMRLANPPGRDELLKIQGVTGVEFLTDQQIRVFFEGDPDITERLMAAAIAGNWHLKEINLDKGALDDVFKQLSSQSS